MTSSREPKTNYTRRFLGLGLFIIVLFGGYSAGWFWFAGRSEEAVRAAIADFNGNGIAADCVNPGIKGFPFRIGLTCDRVEYEDSRQRISASAGNLRTVAQIYQPSRALVELDGPLRVTAPDLPQLQFDWELLHASARLANPVPQRLSVEARKLTGQASFTDGVPMPLFAAENIQTHLRPNGADLDLAATFDGLVIDPAALQGRKLPPLDGSADTSLANGVEMVAKSDLRLRGRTGTIRSMTLTTGGSAGVSVSGPWSVAGDGLIDADLTVKILDPRKLSAILSEAIPEERERIEAALSGLAALGDAPTLPLKIASGKATLGFIPLGMVPAVAR